MKSTIFPAIKLTIVCLIFFMGCYTFLIFGLAQFAPNKGKGELITQDGKSYYANIGYSFTADRYFNSRPSAVAYNAAASAGSNKGTSNPVYLAEVQARIDTFLVHNPEIKKGAIPSDLITASGSGLDPNISIQAALVQIPRIAKIRGISPKSLALLVKQHMEEPLFNFLGPEKINVLKLNIALDKIQYQNEK